MWEGLAPKVWLSSDRPLPSPQWCLAGLVGTLNTARVTIFFLLPRSVEEGLTYRFHAVWGEVLRVLEIFFETCGKQCHPIMRKVSQAGRAQIHP